MQGRCPDERHTWLRSASPRTRGAPSSKYASALEESGNMASRRPDGAPRGTPVQAQGSFQPAYQAYIPGQSSTPPVPTKDDKRIRTSLQRNSSLMSKSGRASGSIDLRSVPKALSPPLEPLTMLQKTRGRAEAVERRGKDGKADWQAGRARVPSVLMPGRNGRKSTQGLAPDQQARQRQRQREASPYQTPRPQQVGNAAPTEPERPQAHGSDHRLAIAAPS
ncbi:hypothetical protein E4U53_005305 [Claviceps sorghi]|nr:hypothetical protein E4U53_005305 [Claviceps sorghi]